MSARLAGIEGSLREFLEEMISKIIREHGTEIVSIALFGSAATKEWVRGKSDIDFIMVIAHEKKRQAVENSMNRILLELDSKYDLQLARTCSTFVRHKNPLVNMLLKLENVLMFGKPFFVFSLNQIEFEDGTIEDARIRVVTTIFDPLSIFLAKMKQTGTTIYGENFIDEIKFSTSSIDKIRIAIAPLWLVAMSLLSFPLDETFSLKHSIKATVWACEDMLFALGIPLSSCANEASIIADIFKDTGLDLSHLEKTIALKRAKFLEHEHSKGLIAKHILSTILFILTLYYCTSNVVRAPSHYYSAH
jgi:predicted nucleotidyltransferase